MTINNDSFHFAENIGRTLNSDYVVAFFGLAEFKKVKILLNFRRQTVSLMATCFLWRAHSESLAVVTKWTTCCPPQRARAPCLLHSSGSQIQLE